MDRKVEVCSWRPRVPALHLLRNAENGMRIRCSLTVVCCPSHSAAPGQRSPMHTLALAQFTFRFDDLQRFGLHVGRVNS